MKIKSTTLLSDLLERTSQNLSAVEKFRSCSFEELNFRPEPDSWSVLECIEHLNYYGNYYLPEMEKQIASSPYPAEEFFKSGFLGNYFAKSMLPKDRLKKMKTLKSQNPIGKVLDKKVLDVFVDHQLQMISLLNKAKKVSLNRTKTGISIRKYLRLRLGDTMRVVIYHNQRHLKQAQNVLKILSLNTAGTQKVKV